MIKAMKTIKQIADELGVSRETVRKQVPKLVPNQVAIGSNRCNLINSDGEEKIRELLGISGSNPVPTSSNSSSNQVTTIGTCDPTVNAIIEMLKTELEIKNKQIGELNLRLAEAMATANNVSQSLQVAQGLHVGTMHQTLLPDNKKPKNKRFFNFFKRPPRPSAPTNATDNMNEGDT